MTNQIKKRECPKCSITLREWYDRQEFTGYKCDNCQYEIGKNEMPATNQTDWEERLELNWTIGALGEEAKKAFERPLGVGLQSPKQRLLRSIKAELDRARKEEREKVLRELQEIDKEVVTPEKTKRIRYLISKLTKERE